MTVSVSVTAQITLEFQGGLDHRREMSTDASEVIVPVIEKTFLEHYAEYLTGTFCV